MAKATESLKQADKQKVLASVGNCSHWLSLLNKPVPQIVADVCQTQEMQTPNENLGGDTGGTDHPGACLRFQIRLDAFVGLLVEPRTSVGPEAGRWSKSLAHQDSQLSLCQSNFLGLILFWSSPPQPQVMVPPAPSSTSCMIHPTKQCRCGGRLGGRLGGKLGGLKPVNTIKTIDL